MHEEPNLAQLIELRENHAPRIEIQELGDPSAKRE